MTCLELVWEKDGFETAGAELLCVFCVVIRGLIKLPVTQGQKII